jgi:hypothetical protein
LTKYHAVKTFWGSGGTAPRILNLDNKWSKMISFTLWSLYPRGKKPRYPWIGGWVDPIANLDALYMREKDLPLPLLGIDAR